VSIAIPPHRWTQQDYDRAALEYLERLPPEHFMEATTQSVQRALIENALGQIAEQRPDFHYFNELLVQQFVRGHLVQVVPDATVILGDLKDHRRSCYQPEMELPLFWVLEYVSPSGRNTEYMEKRQCYEQDLKVPYYLIHDPEAAPLVLCLYHYEGSGYQLVKANEHDRFPIPELNVEIGVVDGWARLWFQGELLLPTGELAARMREVQRRNLELTETNKGLTQANQQLTKRTEELTKTTTELAKTTAELTKTNENLLHKTTDLEATVRQRDERWMALAVVLRGLVEPRARQAGRLDILEALLTADPDTLTRWLTELG
jgi:Uma2 family endonuclease